MIPNVKLLKDYDKEKDGAIVIAGQADGAILNGHRVKKSSLGAEDAHQVGALATVISSIGPITLYGESHIFYFVEWDDMPGLPVGILDNKIEEIPGSSK